MFELRRRLRFSILSDQAAEGHNISFLDKLGRSVMGGPVIGGEEEYAYSFKFVYWNRWTRLGC